jgi:hypothetical protein
VTGDQPALPPSRRAEAVRARLVDTLRRDLIGPGPEDSDLAREVLKENPSRWYLTGFLAPSPEGLPPGEAEEPDEEGSSAPPALDARAHRAARRRGRGGRGHADLG